MKTSALFATIFICFQINAQNFPRDTVFLNGGITNRINFTYLGDGYLTSELNVYQSDVSTINNKLFLTTPFKEYKKYFNAFAVRVVSGASGAKHPNNAPDCSTSPPQPITAPLNYFGSKFDAFSIHRLVVPDSLAKIQGVLAQSAPFYNQVILVVNSTFYGGSGGQIATSTKHSNAAEIAIHELGHSFAGLADEYWAGPQYAMEKPNMTANTNTSTVKWKNWMGIENIGIYPYSGGSGWYRPAPAGTCKMEVLGAQFCAVCREAIIEKIHSLVNPIDSYQPASSSLANPSTDLGFKLNLVLPEPNTLKVTWKRNGNQFATNVDTVTIPSATIGTGGHTITATVIDTTTFTRSDNHFSTHAYTVTWNIGTPTPVIDAVMTKVDLKAYPNPFTSGIQLEYQLEKRSDVKIELVNLAGQTVHSKEFRKQASGKHSTTFNTEKLSLSNGVYFLVFSVNGNRIIEEKIKVGN